MTSLFEQFAEEDATSYVRELILDAVREHAGNPAVERRTFELNRFDLTLDFVGKVAVIEDCLPPDPEIGSECRLALDEFMERLGLR